MGRGAPKNATEAVRWLTEAANGDDLNGLFNLAVLYAKGDGVSPDPEKAASLYRRAAELGHYPSQSRLGYIYAHGQGVPKDRVQAYLWLSLAAQHGIGTALNALESVVKDMSAEEKSNGVALFEEWRGRTRSKNGQVALYPVPS
jgi:TPR repeat protein